TNMIDKSVKDAITEYLVSIYTTNLAVAPVDKLTDPRDSVGVVSDLLISLLISELPDDKRDALMKTASEILRQIEGQQAFAPYAVNIRTRFHSINHLACFIRASKDKPDL
ncbi:hypothetical protein JTW50_002061, partial [Escherichia coli]